AAIAPIDEQAEAVVSARPRPPPEAIPARIFGRLAAREAIAEPLESGPPFDGETRALSNHRGAAGHARDFLEPAEKRRVDVDDVGQVGALVDQLGRTARVDAVAQGIEPRLPRRPAPEVQDVDRGAARQRRRRVSLHHGAYVAAKLKPREIGVPSVD